MSRSIIHCDSPIGPIEVRATDTAVCALEFVEELPINAAERENGETPGRSASPLPAGARPLVEEVERQLAAYFTGALRRFDLPLALEGTPFQCHVWQQLRCVGYGETASYQAIAEAIGKPKAVRAVGAANGRNPVSIIVPCHRIVGSSQGAARPKLTGYGGGLWRKEWLLRHEGVLLV